MVDYTRCEQSLVSSQHCSASFSLLFLPLLPTHFIKFSPCMPSSLVKDRREPLCQSLDMSLQFLPFRHSLCKLCSCKLASGTLFSVLNSVKPWGFFWVLCSALCFEGCRQAAMWAMLRFLSLVSLPSGIAALLSLLPSIWKELFHVFAWFSSCLWWESNSQSS